MKDNFLEQTRELIIRDFEVERTDEETLSEEELLDLLADRIAWLIEYRMEFLLSLMYRMDVKEARVEQALSPGNPEPANRTLARLVLDRQKERIRTKQQYKQDDLDGWEW